MKALGYIKRSDDARVILESWERLRAVGIAVENMVVGAGGTECRTTVASLTGGDSLTVCSLSEICRGLKELLPLIALAASHGAQLHSLDEPWLVMEPGPTDWQAWAEGLLAFESRMRSESTNRGLRKAKADGTKLGRPVGSTTIDDDSLKACLTLYNQSEMTVHEICRTMGIQPRTFYRYRAGHLSDDTRIRKRASLPAGAKNIVPPGIGRQSDKTLPPVIPLSPGTTRGAGSGVGQHRAKLHERMVCPRVAICCC